MKKYEIKFDKKNDDLLILDNIFASEEYLEYADKHNMNVLFTVTTSTSSVEVMMMFQKRGFTFTLYEVDRYATDGTKISPAIRCLFEKSKVKEIVDKI